MLKVAIIGCGKIADDHAAQIRRINDCEIVAVCDSEPLMARQLAQRFQVSGCFSDLNALLQQTKLDVVHVTTPPQTHLRIARACLEAGCHVYVEKPFALSEQDTRELISLANERKRKVTAGHNGQFRHAARKMRALIQSGYLGGPPVHMESYFGYEMGQGEYARAVLSDKSHWIRELPGKLLQNIISHGIARIAEYLTTESPRVIAYGFTSPFLKSQGERELIDELRVMIQEEGGPTAYFTFSSQMRPSLHQFRIYGPKNGLVLDQDQETLIKLRGTRLKSYAEIFVPPVTFAVQNVGNVLANMKIFLASDLHMKSDLKHLIELFYRAIIEEAPVPIPYREILLTARIMDSIVAQLQAQRQQIRALGETGVDPVFCH